MFTPKYGNLALDPVASLFVEHCDSEQGMWLLQSLVTAVGLFGREPTPALGSLFRDLFESCRDDYIARAILEEVLVIWRETSTAPVTARGLCDRWLYRQDVDSSPASDHRASHELGRQRDRWRSR
jgi:hypothetical protein